VPCLAAQQNRESRILKVLVELELNFSDFANQDIDGLMHQLKLKLDNLLADLGRPLLEANVTNITPLPAMTIADKARLLLGTVAKRTLSAIPELRAIVCIPLWGLESKDLPLSSTFLRNDNKTDPLAIKAALAAQLAIVLNQAVAVFPEMVGLAQVAVREATERAQKARDDRKEDAPG